MKKVSKILENKEKLEQHKLWDSDTTEKAITEKYGEYLKENGYLGHIPTIEEYLRRKNPAISDCIEGLLEKMSIDKSKYELESLDFDHEENN